MLTTKTYTVTYEENQQRIREQWVDTYLLGVRVRRQINEVWRKGSEITQELRQLAYNLDTGRCVYCDVAVKDTKRWAIDHLVPQVQGGKTTIMNLVTACMKCNSAKSGNTPEEAGMYPRFGRYDSRPGIAPIPQPYEGWYKDGLSQLMGLDPWVDWVLYVKVYEYGEAFNTDFIECRGVLPFSFHTRWK